MQQKWKIVAVLFVISIVNYGNRAAIASVFPLLRADFALSDVMLAGLGSAFLWSYAVGSPIAGYLADRVSRTRLLLLSLIAWSVVMALTGFVHNEIVLLASRGVRVSARIRRSDRRSSRSRYTSHGDGNTVGRSEHRADGGERNCGLSWRALRVAS
jgi:MFS-type transporter involved in bile tolerance (Atg22 family)